MSVTVVLSEEKSIIVSKEHVSNLGDLKEKIKDEIGILHDLQIFVNKENLVLSDQDFAELIHQEINVPLKFFVKGTDDMEMHSICKKFNINSELNEVEISVFTSRNSILDSIEVSLGSKVSDIKIKLHDEYDIRKDVCVFYHYGFDETKVFPLEVIDEGTFLVDLFFEDGEFTDEARVQLMFKYNKEDDWASMRDTLTIPGIRLKNWSDNTEVLELDGCDIIDSLALKRKVKEKLGIPVELQVFYLDDFFWEERLLIFDFTSYCDSNINGFFEINLFILPTEDSLVQKVCKENGIFFFDPVSVTSESGMLFKYSFDLNSTVGDLFSFISKELEIPAHHLILTADGHELSSEKTKILNIYEDCTEQEYSKYAKAIVHHQVDVHVATRGLLETSLNDVCLSKGIKSLKTISVFYHDKNTLVEKYSISDVPSLDDLSMALRSHFGVFPPVLFHKNDYMRNQMQFHWKTSLAEMFFDKETKSYHDNVDVVVCLDMASVLVGDNDIALVNEFCSKHKVSCLQRIIVQFENQETKEMKVRDGLETIGKIKDIADKLDVSVRGDFVCNGKHFGRGKRLLEIYFENEKPTSDSLVFKYTPPSE